MKKLLVLSVIVLTEIALEATFAVPTGAQIDGAGSTMAATYMNALIAKYNKIFPCPKITYKQKHPSVFAGSSNGINRVLDGKATFAVTTHDVSQTIIDEAADCILQIPFILSSLSIIYHLPHDFTPNSMAGWQGHLNIAPADLCSIYTSTLTWGAVINALYNGTQAYAGSFQNTAIKAFARAESADETSLFVNYFSCAGVCSSFTTQPNVAANASGPFCGTAPGTWDPTVQCKHGTDAVAQAVAATGGSVGYVGTGSACQYGFFPGSTNGAPLGVAGLFITGSVAYTSPQQNPYENPLNYTQPVLLSLLAAVVDDCTGGEHLCVQGAYPIVTAESFVLFATQPNKLIACNIAQFIQFALAQGPTICGFVHIPGECVGEHLAFLDQIHSAICDPCIEPCNPCANQQCPLPSCLPCKI